MFSKVAAHAFEAGDFLNIFLKVLRGFEAHIFTESFSYKRKRIVGLEMNRLMQQNVFIDIILLSTKFNIE